MIYFQNKIFKLDVRPVITCNSRSHQYQLSLTFQSRSFHRGNCVSLAMLITFSKNNHVEMYIFVCVWVQVLPRILFDEPLLKGYSKEFANEIGYFSLCLKVISKKTAKMLSRSIFHGGPHPIKTIQKSVYLIVDFYLVFMGCGLP